ncbi:pep-cterm sorting domain-containing protein [Anaeramoeba ignava]|uniref:Pep-cterm sorting domain-containing protein n=1 Tax=Anaeramoeba ignava TaxID=1746090 RepID=A0A9Q0LUL9_ANAIG|nr:pep-cterm sorting domain-containing protein [Anaeramoeba ignava]
MALEIITSIFEIGAWLKGKFDDYKDTKEEAKRLIKRIEALENPLKKIKELNSKNTNVTTLQNVLETVQGIKTLVENYEKSSKLKKFFSSKKKEFEKYDQRLDSYIGDLNMDLTILTHTDIQDLAKLFKEMRNDQQSNDAKTQKYLQNLSQEIQRNQIQTIDEPRNQIIFEYEKTNLGFIEQKFGLEKKSGEIICGIFQLKAEDPINFEKIMKEILEFSISDWNYQIKILFTSWDLDHNQFLDKEELTKAIHDFYFLITCLQSKKIVGSLQEYLINLNEEEKKKFYNVIEELVAKNEIDLKIEQIFDSLNSEANEINFSQFESYCNYPGNFVIQFLNLIKTVLNEAVGTFLITNQIETKNESSINIKKLEKFMKIPTNYENKLESNKILQDPVLVNGRIYERKYIEKIIQENPENPTIPEKNERIDPKFVLPILDLKSEIEKWKTEKISKCVTKSQKIKQSNSDIAYKILEFARKLEPENLQIINLQISLLEKELKIPEELAKQQFAKGEILFKQREYREAEQLLTKSFKLTTNPNLIENALLILKEIYSANKLTSKILETNISLSRIYLEQNPQKTKDILIQIEEGNSDQDTTTANLYLEVYSLLISAEEALGNHKETPNWYFKKANCYFMKKNYSKAIEYLNKVLEMNPDYLEALQKLAFLYNLKKDKSNECLIHIKIGQIYSKKKENDKAIEEFKKALLCDKSNSLAFNLLFEMISKQKSIFDLITLVKNYKIQDQETETFLDKISQISQIFKSQLEEESKKKDQKINQLEEEMKELKKRINETTTSILEEYEKFKKMKIQFRPFLNSEIISEKEYAQKLQEWINDNDFFSKMKKGFSAKRDGFDCKKWHSICDNKGKTLVIIKTKDNFIFGGFTQVGWTTDESKWSEEYGSYGWIKDWNAFIFSLRNDKGDRKSDKFSVQKGKEEYAVKYHQNFGPEFGNYPADFYVHGNLKTGKSDFGDSYNLPNGITYQSNEARSYLAGSYNSWVVDELETYFI